MRVRGKRRSIRRGREEECKGKKWYVREGEEGGKEVLYEGRGRRKGKRKVCNGNKGEVVIYESPWEKKM